MNMGAGGPAKTRMSLGPGTTLPRYSLGGGMGTTAKKAKANKRMSMMPTVGASMHGGNRRQSTVSVASRRKSIATMGSATSALKSDPRPLNEKSFRAQCIETLIRFLSEHNYDQALSPKILHRPTGKDFEHVVIFLFRMLDPSRKFGSKVADEVTVMMKGLRYPFNISKTSLAAVGSPHTWPALLASLVWLVELLEYDELAGLSEDDDDDASEEDIDRIFFTYIRKAYQCFLCGDDNRYEELDAELAGKFRERDVVIEEEITDLERKRSDLGQDLEFESEKQSLIPELEQRKRDFTSDKLKWDKLIRQFLENKDIMVAKVREREAEVRAKEVELAQAEHAKSKVQSILDEQELNPADAERMTQEKRSLEASCNTVLEQRDDMQNETWEVEMSISKRTQRIEALLEEYNAIAKSLKLTQAAAAGQQRQGADIQLRLDTRRNMLVSLGADQATGQGERADVGAITSALQDLREESIKKTHQIRTSNMELHAKVEENDEAQEAVRSVIRGLEQRLQEAETQLQQDKSAMDAELASRAAETEAVEEDIHRLTLDAEQLAEPLREAEETLEALRDRLSSEATDHMTEIEALDDDLHMAVDSFLSFKENVAQSFADLKGTLQGSLDAAAAFCEEHEARVAGLAAVSP
ncbi:Kinetochore protein NDC80-like [Hondaea fermentalgiana]|uniref:Kinetochore protein NDC80 n=1 Tax=Hondaea fermentalgiana TaxID=2315210 RepID=A0A2R5H1W7_9STRA|nr:Kinetochore protein NDC80-like [Hondaea fermentalgiana]|eukprot:GBG34364.1 Kinetochore protein NDC80-like [Hondaea fermentalgiana]